MVRDRTTLVSLATMDPPYRRGDDEGFSDDGQDDPPRQWYHYFPLCGLLFLVLAPHPSWLIVLVNYHLQVLHAPVTFTVHLLVGYTLTFLAFSSLMVCVVRDPGPISNPGDRRGGEEEGLDDVDGDVETSLTEALMEEPPVDEDDFNSPGKWCKKCWAPKPERAHHCSLCRRCVLKMDHHCPWIAYKCIGHRTYPAFIHFLTCVILLAIYMSVVCGLAVLYAFSNPFKIDETTPIHELILFLSGVIITMVVGSFLIYHLYLITTNQTTLENLSPFLLLREMPALTGPDAAPGALHEYQLSYSQRRIVKRAHGYIRLYDVGWRKNWAQVFGWERRHGWVYRLLIGGASKGDGRSFQRNPQSNVLLSRLGEELTKEDL